MLLKFTKTSGAGGAGLGSSSSSMQASSTYAVRGGGTGMRMTMSTSSTMSPRIHRKGFRIPSKRQPGKGLPGKLHSIARTGHGKLVPGKRIPQRLHPAHCDNSNDSGFGFDQHTELRSGYAAVPGDSRSNCASTSDNAKDSVHRINLVVNNALTNTVAAAAEAADASNTLQQHQQNQQLQQQQQQSSQQQQSPQQHLIRAIPVSRFIGTRSVTRVANKRQPTTPLNSIASSNDGHVNLEIVSQPEQQHRARYQTEGSRGAVKDRSGNGFPIVRLTGYAKATVLQVFIGTDIGRVAPHMFYQACKVAGKNSTQCYEKKVDGTMVIEIDFKPETDMTITCDCVGILKERNVDVEHRFPEHLAQKNKKKSTRCRMVFRTQLTCDDGSTETLQVCSNPIICTQPPGVPEICKKSLNSCPVDGGLELFIIGKNFFKDTHVVFQETFEGGNADDPETEVTIRQQLIGRAAAIWEQNVLPDKEYLHQTHLICTVPPYLHQNLLKPVTVQVSIISSGKKSEPQTFTYTPKGRYTTLAAASTLSNTLQSQGAVNFMDTSTASSSNSAWATGSTTSAPVAGATIVETKHEIDSDMMPPPITTQIPIGLRRSSLSGATPMITDQQMMHLNAVSAEASLKCELLDENSSNSPLTAEALNSPEALSPCSPNALQYHAHYTRKTSLDTIMYDQSNSMPGFPVPAPASAVDLNHNAVAVAVELAVKNEIVKHVVQQHQAPQQQQQQSAANVRKFIDDLTKSTSVVNSNGTSESALFTTSAAIDHALTDILQQKVGVLTNQHKSATVTPNVLQRSLSLSSNHSSSSLSGSETSSNSSSLTQDIILNSEPAAALGAGLPMQQLATVPVTAVTGPLSTDIIMNPAVSPSTILCSANGAATAVVPNILAPHQVTMANSILNDIAMQAEPTQQDAAVAALALSNIMMSPPNAAAGVDVGDTLPPTPTVMQPEEAATATSTAVSNMIIKAAADFITTQEQEQHHYHQQHQQCAHVQRTANTSATDDDPLVNLLLNHSTTPETVAVEAAAVAVATAGFPSLSTVHLPVVPPTPQESLIVALASENSLQKSVATAAVTTNRAVMTQQASAPSNAGSILPAAVAAVAVQPPIPQELTTMSDQDLISYINPSTFDQL